MSSTITQKAVLLIAIALLAGCSVARPANPGEPAKPGDALVGTWIAPGAKPDKGFTKLTFNADRTGFGAYRHADDEIRYGTTGTLRYVPHIKETISNKSGQIEWHADASHIWLNVKDQSSGEEMDYNVDANTLTYGPDEATQFVMHREAQQARR